MVEHPHEEDGATERRREYRAGGRWGEAGRVKNRGHFFCRAVPSGGRLPLLIIYPALQSGRATPSRHPRVSSVEAWKALAAPPSPFSRALALGFNIGSRIDIGRVEACPCPKPTTNTVHVHLSDTHIARPWRPEPVGGYSLLPGRVPSVPSVSCILFSICVLRYAREGL